MIAAQKRQMVGAKEGERLGDTHSIKQLIYIVCSGPHVCSGAERKTHYWSGLTANRYEQVNSCASSLSSFHSFPAAGGTIQEWWSIQMKR